MGAVLVAALVASPAPPIPPGVATASSGTFAAADPDPQPRCTITDPRLDEVSGLAWAPDGLRVVNDSGNPSTVYRLSPRCAVAGTRPVAVNGRDVEDLARGADGTLWLADTGDNDRVRATVAVLRLPASDPRAEIVTRLVYPDGAHDAETLLLPGDARPVLVTKDPGGRGAVYTTDAPLPAVSTGSGAMAPVPLRRVGTVVVPPSDTPSGGESGLASILGGSLITGGAVSADGRVVALRTYTDAWLYPATSTATAPGVVAALTGTPVRVPLPGEPQGEAVTFAPDGTLYSAGESPAGGPRATVRAVPGAAALAEDTPTTASPTPGPTPTAVPAAEPAPGPATNPVVAVVVGVVLLVLVGGALLAAARARRRR